MMIKYLSICAEGEIVVGKSTGKIIIGLKQSTKALQRDDVETIYLAEDTDKHILAPLAKLAEDKAVPTIYVASKRDLGIRLGIDVGAAVAVVLKKEHAGQAD